MKYPHTRLVTSFLIGGLVTAGFSIASAQPPKPLVITPPAVHDGSNWSRAPFPAARQFDDVKGPTGEAIDTTLPPNTPATNNELAGTPGRVGVRQHNAIGTETPGLMPTGRSTVTVATSMDAATFAPTIRSADFATRQQIIADIESRMKTSEKAMASIHTTDMSAEGRRAYSAVSDDAKAKAKALKRSLKAAEKATESNWDAARAQLASDYEAYAAALASVDAANH